MRAEDSCAVIWDEFDVSPAPVQLKCALASAVTEIASSVDNREIGRQESLAHVPHESEKLLHITLQVIEEDAAHPARLVAMVDDEILVAPLFEARVITRVVFVAYLFGNCSRV